MPIPEGFQQKISFESIVLEGVLEKGLGEITRMRGMQMLELSEKIMAQASFDWGNEVLYHMCRENPSHKDLSVITGKIWLIGRSYSAAIERKAGPKMKEGENFYLSQVAPAIKSSKIDNWLKTVSLISRVTEENLESVLSCHKNVTDLFASITGIEKRSLASKYLHFHAPSAFFIYDSIASSAAKDEPNCKKILSSSERSDKEYEKFCRRCLVIRGNIEKRKELSPRDIDKYLLGY